MYSMHNEGKSVVVPERLIRILKNKIYTHMKAVSKNLYFDVSDVVDKYNNTVHRTIGMKPIDVKSNSHAQCNVDSNEKDPKFKIGDRVKTSRYKNIFAKGCTPNWSDIFVVGKIKNTVPWTCVIYDLNSE